MRPGVMKTLFVLKLLGLDYRQGGHNLAQRGRIEEIGLTGGDALTADYTVHCAVRALLGTSICRLHSLSQFFIINIALLKSQTSNIREDRGRS